MQLGWTWERNGGDWIDARGQRHGATPWFSAATDAGPTGLVNTYRIDATALLQKVQRDPTWCAIRLTSTKASRKIAGVFNDEHKPPVVEVKYTDGSSASLRCSYSSSVNTGLPSPGMAVCPLPAFLEFDRPSKPVLSAHLLITVTEHSGGLVSNLEAWLLDPPRNQDPQRLGVAAQAGPLDEGIRAQPGVIGAHRYLDSSSLEDFVLQGQFNTLASREFDPALWGGTSDTTKFPHLGLGKFITANHASWAELVRSDYRGDGFQPLAPGLAALRMHMEAQAKIDGAVVGYGGTGAANASIFMPEALFGRLPRIFVRHYVRIGTPEGDRYVRKPEDRLHVFHRPEQVAPVWTDWAGKWGITPDHMTSYGGTSGSAGGGNGWQMRLSWADSDANFNGPNEGGFRPGYHLFDFGPMNPPGHNYSGDTGAKAAWGQRGGLGGMLYANTWYCVETELKLNTVMKEAPGYQADGELRAWIDGRLVFERTGLVFRSLPLKSDGIPSGTAVMPPVRELGVRALWLNWYHGGVTQNTVPRTMFITGLAYGTEYIGPMRR